MTGLLRFPKADAPAMRGSQMPGVRSFSASICAGNQPVLCRVSLLKVHTSVMNLLFQLAAVHIYTVAARSFYAHLSSPCVCRGRLNASTPFVCIGRLSDPSSDDRCPLFALVLAAMFLAYSAAVSDCHDAGGGLGAL